MITSSHYSLLRLRSDEEFLLVLDKLREKRFICHALTSIAHFTFHKVNESAQGTLGLLLGHLLHGRLEATFVRKIVLNVRSVRWNVLIHQLWVDLGAFHSMSCLEFWLTHFVHILSKSKSQQRARLDQKNSWTTCVNDLH